jgi:hypothetical protein
MQAAAVSATCVNFVARGGGQTGIGDRDCVKAASAEGGRTYRQMLQIAMWGKDPTV